MTHRSKHIAPTAQKVWTTLVFQHESAKHQKEFCHKISAEYPMAAGEPTRNRPTVMNAISTIMHSMSLLECIEHVINLDDRHFAKTERYELIAELIQISSLEEAYALLEEWEVSPPGHPDNHKKEVEGEEAEEGEEFEDAE